MDLVRLGLWLVRVRQVGFLIRYMRMSRGRILVSVLGLMPLRRIIIQGLRHGSILSVLEGGVDGMVIDMYTLFTM